MGQIKRAFRVDLCSKDADNRAPSRILSYMTDGMFLSNKVHDRVHYRHHQQSKVCSTLNPDGGPCGNALTPSSAQNFLGYFSILLYSLYKYLILRYIRKFLDIRKISIHEMGETKDMTEHRNYRG